VTPIADMIEKMSADGVPMATILLAVRTAEHVAACGKSGGIPVDTAAEKRRAYDRDRKAEMRKSGGKSGGIPPEQSIALTSLLPEDPQKENKKEEKKEEATRRKTGCVLPDTWQPSEGHYAEGTSLGHHSSEVDNLAGAMRIWSKTNAHRAVARKSDWDLTFTGWMQREWKNGATNGQRPDADRTHSGARESGTDAVLAGVARATDRRARERQSAGRGDGQAPDGAHDAGEHDPDFFRAAHG
jgi:hypothetical protein